MTQIHPNALVHPKAKIASDVEIGPFSIVGEHVQIGRGCRIGPHAVIDGWTEIGEGSLFSPYVSIGGPPQDIAYKGGSTRLKIGRSNTFREYVTVNRGTEHGRGETVIGDNNLLMAYVHVAHDCVIGNHVIMANAATLAGHITIGDHAILGGLVGIHQFIRVGEYAMIGGCSKVVQDVPPFMIADGNRAKLYGPNHVGLRRNEFSTEEITRIKTAYKIIFRSGLTLQDAIQQVLQKWDHPHIRSLVSFIEQSKRGICR